MGLLVDQSDGTPDSCVLRSGAVAVGGQAFFEIRGDSGVEGAVAAMKDVDAPARHGQR